MYFLLIGASGRTGTLVLEEVLRRGHTVTALVRDRSKVTPRDGLTLVEGTRFEPLDIEKALAAAPSTPTNATIVTLNTARKSDNPFAAMVSPPQLMTQSMKTLVTASKATGVKKVVDLQAHGVGNSFPTLFFVMRVMVKKSNMSFSYKDHESAETVLRESGLDFVFARPTRLTDGPAAPIHFYGDTGRGISSFAGMNRRSTAEFLVDAAEKKDWDGTTPVMSN
ncbi:hypothetical protein HYALB_00006873 [Hymenoscyphus albidus]|uniref:NAD(P)-binding domain-containing protein n=1 Tax=Hymenoscyphus albidus TaxID=595503 RepID=A0A9N9Q432_9HELO|nr:hypothetical protein HYALB_00006873 [Hymenoscyphus albidus]